MVLYIYGVGIHGIPKRFANAALMLGHRRRRWTSIKAALVKRVVFAGFGLFWIYNYEVIHGIREKCELWMNSEWWQIRRVMYPHIYL